MMLTPENLADLTLGKALVGAHQESSASQAWDDQSKILSMPYSTEA
jgi:hypothetical protein